jgi:hypothetical protein
MSNVVKEAIERLKQKDWLKQQEYNRAWNAAIEAAAKELETYEYIEGAADRIRDLKK